MTIRAKRFTPEILLSSPRRSAGIPNADGSKILHVISTHSFENQTTRSEVRVLNVSTEETQLITATKGASEPTWLSDGSVLLLLPGEDGKTKVAIGDPANWDKSKCVAGTIDGPASSVKLALLSKDTYAFAVAAQATPKGALYNPETAPKPKSTGRLYTTTFVRHWDTWITPNKYSIWFGKLSKQEGCQYKLSELTNALQGTGLESPVPPFGGSDNYDLSISGIIFVAKDPAVNAALNTKMNFYYIPIADFEASEVPKPLLVPTGNLEGAATSPSFSSDGKKAAFLKMRQNGYEADKNQLLVIPDIKRPGWIVNVYTTPDGRGSWDKSPQSVSWSDDGRILYMTAEDTGRSCMFVLSVDSLADSSFPVRVKSIGSVTDIRPLQKGKAFLSGSSLIDNSTYYSYDSWSAPHAAKVISSHSHNGSTLGLSPGQVDQIWWPGAKKGTFIHAWIVQPSTFNPNEKYPLAYVIHGGPQSSWLDSWSYRWNPAVLAEQGYVVVCPNPTGSTGYGQELTDAIKGQWGGLPYQDLVIGFDFIAKNRSYIDTTRAVALGASYGGFMMNWIQGQPLGRKFKAIVCHDGVFSMAGQMASEELWFPNHDLEGWPWQNPDAWQQWDPSRFTKNWSTPQLVIHSDLDYRLTISEGLAAFNVLQARGVKSQFLTFPDENHWVLKPENSLMWHKVVLDWINEHVGLPKYSERTKKSKEGGEEDGFEGLTAKVEATTL